MGFITTGNTTQLTAYLTQRGRELLLNGVDSDITASFFSLGDSDSNYKIDLTLTGGFVPDLSGDDSGCVISLADNVNIKYPLQYDNTTSSIIPQVMFKRTDNGNYYNVLDCLIHLDSIGRYQLYNSSDNQLNPNALKINSNLLSPLQDLFQEVAILSNPNPTPVSTDFSPYQNMIFQMLFDPTLYPIFNNTYIDTLSGNTVNQDGFGATPIVLTFSSLDTTGGTLFGAGKTSVGIYSREIGYLYKPYNSSITTFYSAINFETTQNYTFFTDANNNVINLYDDYTLAAQINSKDSNDGIVKNFIYRGDTNLTNISDTLMQPLINEIKFANQYAKLFADTTPTINGLANSSYINGLMQKEISNLKDFVETSNIFNIVAGTNEYRTSKLSFSVYPQNNTGNTLPATLNIMFSFNEDILLNGDADYSHISDEGDTVFIEYDFLSTNGVFKNVTKSGVYVKNNCGNGFQGSSVSYVVSGGTYTGATQAIADTLALNDVNTNGQSYANTYGTCSAAQQFSSSVFSQNVTKNNCAAGYAGSSVLVSFPAGYFTSYVSQTDANQQAVTAAQQIANNSGTCTLIQSGGGCLLAGQKVIVNVNNSFHTKNIEDIVIGDSVWTFDESGNNFNSYLVEKTFSGRANSWYKIKTFYGDKTINCSPTHLFMVNGKEKEAQLLTNNDKLSILGEDNKTIQNIQIKSIELINENIDIYNIEVENAHTYFTENLIWHHNKTIQD